MIKIAFDILFFLPFFFCKSVIWVGLGFGLRIWVNTTVLGFSSEPTRVGKKAVALRAVGVTWTGVYGRLWDVTFLPWVPLVFYSLFLGGNRKVKDYYRGT